MQEKIKDDTISRQAAIEAALSFIVEYCGAAFDENMQIGLKQCLDGLPSAEVEIVRCQDCEHADYSGLPKGRIYCMKNGSYMYEDDFCSKAERYVNGS